MKLILPPPAIGPHEGREIDLMLQGQKQLAHFMLPPNPLYLEERKAHYSSPPSLQLITRHELLPNGHVLENFFLVLLGQEDLVDRYLDLQNQAQGKGFVPELEHEIGSLLSYTQREIDTFLAWANLPETRTNPTELDPHHGQELELLIAGRKNLALFDDSCCDQTWQKLEELEGCFDLTFTDYEFACKGQEYSVTIGARPCAERQVPRFLSLLKARLTYGFEAEREQEFWAIQGYEAQESARYIAWHQDLLEKLEKAP